MDKTDLEGNSDTSGGGIADTTPSQAQGQPSDVNLASLVADLQRKLEAQNGEIRALKSGKDKAVDRAIKSQEETLGRLAKYLGVDEAKVLDAQKQSILDDLVAERLGNLQPSAPVQGRTESTGQPAGFDAATAISMVEGYNLPVNDPTFIALLRDRSLTEQKVKDFILAKVAPPKTPNAADFVATPVTTGANSGKSVDALTIEFQREMLNAPRGKAGESTRRMIKDKYSKQGVPVDNIVFS